MEVASLVPMMELRDQVSISASLRVLGISAAGLVPAWRRHASVFPLLY